MFTVHDVIIVSVREVSGGVVVTFFIQGGSDTILRNVDAQDAIMVYSLCIYSPLCVLSDTN